jgi:hypothetical protein
MTAAGILRHPCPKAMDPKRRAAASAVGNRVIVPAPASDRRTRSISRENRPERSPGTPKFPTRRLCPGLSDQRRRHVARSLQSKTRLASGRASQSTTVQSAFRGHDDQSGEGVNPRWTVFHNAASSMRTACRDQVGGARHHAQKHQARAADTVSRMRTASPNRQDRSAPAPTRTVPAATRSTAPSGAGRPVAGVPACVARDPDCIP